MSNAKVRQIDLFQFSGYGKKPLQRMLYEDGQCLTPDEVVERARQELNDPQEWQTFDLTNNNCEHFATYCKTGQKRSLQFENFEEFQKSLIKKIKIPAKESYDSCCYQ